MGHHEYKPLADMLVEMAERYGKPVFISETGAEGSGRPSWLHYVCNEVRDGEERGVDVRGHLPLPGHRLSRLGQFRHGEAGLFSTITADGSRHVDERLFAEFKRSASRFARSPEREVWRLRPRADQTAGAACGSSDGVPTNGQPSRQ